MEYFNVRDAENLLYISFTPNIFVEPSFSSSSKESVTLKSANVIFLTFLCQFKDLKSSFWWLLSWLQISLLVKHIFYCYHFSSAGLVASLQSESGSDLFCTFTLPSEEKIQVLTQILIHILTKLLPPLNCNQ